MKDKLLLVLSHFLVAVIASAATFFIFAMQVPEHYSKVEQLEDLIAEKFIGESDITVMEDAAADAVVESLGDRWSYYISQEDYAAYMERMDNAYVGIGVTIQPRKDEIGLDVIDMVDGGPAQEAGMQIGDVIIAVDGKSIAGQDTGTTRNQLKGKKGTVVSVTVLREQQEITLSVTRRQIEVSAISGQLLEGGIGLVTIENFDARCAKESIAAIESLMEQGATKLIFDVRNNTGGYKDELVALLDYLVPEGLIFRSEYYDGKIENDHSDARELNVPMAVLVNENSYSAAEFFPAALRDYGKAVIVGEQTCGKGYFQNTYLLQDGSAVVLSIGKYYTPKGENLAGVGLTPDVEVEVDDETKAYIYYGMLEPAQDPQIQAAVEALKDK